MNDGLLDTLDADVANFLDIHVLHERCLAENTRQTYARGLARFRRYVRDGGIADYLMPQASEIAGYAESLHREGLSPSSRAITLISLKMFYRRLTELGRISAASARPVEMLPTPRTPERVPRVLTVEQVRRLLEAPGKTSALFLRDRAILEFSYASAFRASEVSDLRLDNLYLDAAMARVQGKGGKSRLGLLGEPAVEAMNAYLHLLRPDLAARAMEPAPWVFLSHSGERLTRQLLWQLVKGYAVTAGLPSWVGVHSLRHAAATHLLQGGADVRYVQEYLGHSRVKTTSVYLNLDLSDLRRVHERFLAYRHGDETPSSSEAPPDPVWIDKQYGVRWTALDDDLVRTLSVDEAMQRTGRSRSAVLWRRRILGVRCCIRWTREEDELVRSLSPREAAAKLPDRTLIAIHDRRSLLGVGAASWTAEEDEILRSFALIEAAERLPRRSYAAIKRRRRDLGIENEDARPWTPAEDELVRTLPFHEAVKRARRSPRAVKLRRLELLTTACH